MKRISRDSTMSIISRNKLIQDPTIATKKPIANVAVTSRAALGEIGNRVNNRTSSFAFGSKKPTDIESAKPESKGTINVEARKPLRSTSLALNAKPTVPLAAKPTLKSLKDDKPLVPTVAARRPLTGGIRNVIQAQVHVRKPTTAFSSKPPVTRSTSITSVKDAQYVGIAKYKKVVTASIIVSKQTEISSVAATTTVTEIDTDSVQLDSEYNIAPISYDKEPLKTSEAYSAAMIPDIDSGDRYLPQLVSEFANDIYDYLRHLEHAQIIRSEFLTGHEVTGRMRGILMEWLVQVHMRFHLLPETMYMTVMLIDRYLMHKRVAKDQLQLLGVTAMFLASKYEEIYAPEIGDFIYITDNTYDKEQMRRMERLILRTLSFDLGRPSAIHFLRRYSKAADSDDYKHTMAKYFLELTFVDYSLAYQPPSLVAAAAMWLSLKLLGDGKWTNTLTHYTTYTEAEVWPTVRTLCRLTVNIYDKNSKFQAVRSKYTSKKFLEIATHESLSSPTIRLIALQS